jgi:hypothetical protein
MIVEVNRKNRKARKRAKVMKKRRNTRVMRRRRRVLCRNWEDFCSSDVEGVRTQERDESEF